MTAPELAHDRGVWTIPNAISLARLAGVPVFLWLLLGEDRPVAAGILFAVLGATDWVDGYIARRFDQGSEIGKILDPVSDRIMLIAGALGLIVSGELDPSPIISHHMKLEEAAEAYAAYDRREALKIVLDT